MHPLAKGIHSCGNEEPPPFSRGDNYELLNIVC